MFLEIFKHISDVSTKLAIGRVNKAFRLLVRDSLLADLNWTTMRDMHRTARMIDSDPDYNLSRHPIRVCISLVEVEPPQVPSSLRMYKFLLHILARFLIISRR